MAPEIARAGSIAGRYDQTMVWIHGVLAAFALAVATGLRPWRAAPPAWPVLAWCLLMPLSWSTDQLSAMPLLQPLAGSCLLMLMVGWPLAVLLLVPVVLATWSLGGGGPAAALQQGIWLGLVPMTLALALGAASRRWLPHHLFVYILGRGFFATALAVGMAGALSVWLNGVPSGLSAGDVVLARGLVASGDAFITGMLVAIFVAFRPHWLATYTDRIYLPRT